MLSTPSKPCFALVDCNNFYASCERVFNPKLENKPVIILSSNDGCVIARSNEAKMLGIKMSEPFFKIQQLCKRYHVNIFSTNFALYGDMSKRVMQTLQDLCPVMEIYSIDEAFLRLERFAVDSVLYAEKIRKTILQNVGIPVSIGLAPTKTLAKVAGQFAKSQNKGGVFDLRDENVVSDILKTYPIESLWGVGRQWADKLHQLNIYTASQLLEKPDVYLKKHFSIMMTRLVNELRGVSCLYLEEMQTRQNIVCSRSFGKPVTDYDELSQAVSTFAANACFKARKQKTKAQGVSVFIRTSAFSEETKFYSGFDSHTFVTHSNDTQIVLKSVLVLLKKIYRKGYVYKKAGVMLLNLRSEKNNQSDLFQTSSDVDNTSLMHALDNINHKFGQHSLFLGAEGIRPTWKANASQKSPSYTTNWRELKEVG